MFQMWSTWSFQVQEKTLLSDYCFLYSSRECGRIARETHPTRRRDHSSSNSRRHSRYGWLLIITDLYLGEKDLGE